MPVHYHGPRLAIRYSLCVCVLIHFSYNRARKFVLIDDSSQFDQSLHPQTSAADRLSSIFYPRTLHPCTCYPPIKGLLHQLITPILPKSHTIQSLPPIAASSTRTTTSVAGSYDHVSRTMSTPYRSRKERATRSNARPDGSTSEASASSRVGPSSRVGGGQVSNHDRLISPYS
ncbi:hypothetical protein CC80DRAFT_500669 [Byssothecium circinans]|uniref:Uncharacterized protein n=1 Tax=Byssothecium circinans TaxID=147558 RepID=A0A6A5U8Z9_9PLEO|nr:hypothetical protein CC80DRAFT_500669 [Byssothecium circinans]